LVFLTVTYKKRLIIGALKLLGRLLIRENRFNSAMEELLHIIGTMLPMSKIFAFDKYKFLRVLFFDVWHDIAEGSTLSFCLKKHPLVNAEIIKRIEQAERNGTLPLALTRIDSPDPEHSESNDDESAGMLFETDSSIIRLVNAIINGAIKTGADKVAVNALPERANIPEPEPSSPKKIEMEGIPEELTNEQPASVPIFFYSKGRWKIYQTAPYQYKWAIIRRLLFIAEIPYWTQSESEGRIMYRSFRLRIGDEKANIKISYSPENERAILILKEER